MALVCKPCDKVFSGFECLQQHEASEKHKKKIRQLQQTSLIASSSISHDVCNNSKVDNSNSNNGIFCRPCSKSFMTLAEFMDHSASEEHVYRVLKQKFEPNSSPKKIPECDSTTQYHQLQNNSSETDSIYNKSGFSSNTIHSNQNYYSRCELCDKNFSGPEPYQQHIDSLAHKKKSVIQATSASTPMAEISTNVMGAPFSCKICDKSFTGPAPYDQHLKSEKHNKKVAASGGESKFAPWYEKRDDVNTMAVDSNAKVEKEIESPYFCKICSVPCSGPIPYTQHINSTPHAKNILKNQTELQRRERNALLSQLNSNPGSQITSLVELNSNVVQDGKGDSSSDLGSSIKNFLDLKIDNVKPSHLNMTFFHIEEEVDFDKNTKNNINIESELDYESDIMEE